MSKSNAVLEINNSDSCPVWNYENLNDIPLIDNDSEYSKFFDTFLLPNKPCLIRELCENWSCKWSWIKNDSLNVEHFRNCCENVQVPVSNCGKREFNVQKKCTMSLYEYLDYWQSYKVSSGSPKDCLYLKDWHFFRDFPSENVYRVPKYFASDWLNEYYKNFPSLNDDYRFVYIGPKGSWTPFHADVFTSFSWSVNISGRKKWILMSPGTEKYFTDNLGNLKYDIDTVDVENAKKANLPIFSIIQKSGEGIFVPSGWHHQVWNLEDTISINHNWINGCNVHFVWESLQKALKAVKKEIFDCQDMDNWLGQCQILLSATFGFDYNFFYSFLLHIARQRLNCLNKVTECFPVIGNWEFGQNHVEFDLRRALIVLNAIEKDEDFAEIAKNDENQMNFNTLLESVDDLNIFLNR